MKTTHISASLLALASCANVSAATPSLDELEQLKKQAELAIKAQAELVHSNASWNQEMILYLSFGLLFFGIMIVLIMAYLFHKSSKPELILRTFCVPLILIFAVFLPLVGFSSEQTAPAIGLLGTVAGYLLGKSGRLENQAEVKRKADHSIEPTRVDSGIST